ncbi:MAG: hypothetical protein ACFCVF_15435 [Kineosporiaceae bacterium]
MWGWVAVWLLVALLGAGWLVLLGREVVRKGVRLAEDLAVASERATAAASPPPVIPDQRRDHVG